jgi:hypothetical protein
MHKLIAFILTIIYLTFSAGIVLHVQGGARSEFVGIETYYADNKDASDNEPLDASSRIKIVNLHKVHKHLAASRTFLVQRANVANHSAAIHISGRKSAFKKTAAAASSPTLSQAPIFIKNCVLRV